MNDSTAVLKDAGTSAVAVTAAYGVHVSWYDLAAQSYTILMGAGAAALMVGRLLILWRELRGRGKGERAVNDQAVDEAAPRPRNEFPGRRPGTHLHRRFAMPILAGLVAVAGVLGLWVVAEALLEDASGLKALLWTGLVLAALAVL